MKSMGWSNAATAAECGLCTQDIDSMAQGVLDFRLAACQTFAVVFNDPSWPVT
jgi:hypothetical protein